MAYHYLSTNFHAKNRHEGFTNDEIFLFGFSRGAYTARVLCGLVTEMGLLRPQQLHEFPRAFEIYKKLSKMAAKKTDKGKPFIDWMDYFVGSLPASDRDFWHGLRVSNKMYDNVKVKAIGVWDTVWTLVYQNLLWLIQRRWAHLDFRKPGFPGRFLFSPNPSSSTTPALTPVSPPKLFICLSLLTDHDL